MTKTYTLNGIVRADVSDRNCEVCTLNALYKVNTRETRAQDVPPCNHKAVPVKQEVAA